MQHNNIHCSLQWPGLSLINTSFYFYYESSFGLNNVSAIVLASNIFHKSQHLEFYVDISLDKIEELLILFGSDMSSINVPSLSRAVNHHHSGSNLQAISQEWVSSQ